MSAADPSAPLKDAQTARPRRVAVVAALHDELSQLLAEWSGQSATTPRAAPPVVAAEARPSDCSTCTRVAGRDVWQLDWQGHELIAVLSGIGKVAAATTATLLIERFAPGALVFVGVAGGLAPTVRVGDVVVADALLQHDMDASPLFPRHEVPLTGISRFASHAGLVAGLQAAAQAVLADAPAMLGDAAMRDFGLNAPNVHTGLIVSGDRFVATQAESDALRRELPDALAVEMEGAALAQVCQAYGLPFAVLRTISDRADDAAHVDFPRFTAQVASRYSAAIVRHWLGAAVDTPADCMAL